MEWIFEENKAFEIGLIELGHDNPNLVKELFYRVPGKTIEQIQNNYDALLRDVEIIESGCFDEKLDDLYGHKSNQEGLTSIVPNVTNISVQRRRGIPWTDDEHE
ncbi:protein RADIALIS-like 4 [Silene latifolia]|uniref:protein RADIALIS-like 4 n=1 Tax=Silene latifolia TaxID=37657 RepID=UPI003D76B17E